jgi:tetratricopeptide (TPR) repeat protein
MQLPLPKESKMTNITPKEFMDALKVINDLELSGNLEEADNRTQALYKVVGNHPTVLHTKGIIAFKRGRYKEGLTFVESAIKLEPTNPLYYRNIIELYKFYGELDKALVAARKAVELTPGDFICNFNLAVIYMERNEYDDSIIALHRCLEINPNSSDAKFCLAEINMLLGNYKDGVELYEHRYNIFGSQNSLPKLTAPIWSNEKLDDKTILLLGDQGYGDTVQFGRYIPLLIEKGLNVKLGISEEMKPMFDSLNSVIKISSNLEEIGNYDIVLPASSLMRYCLLNDIDLFETKRLWLGTPKTESIKKWADIIATLQKRRLKIGLCWAGRPSHKNDKKRSMQLVDLKPILDEEQFEVYSLQKDLPALQIAQYNQFKCAFSDCNQSLTSWEETIGLIMNLDFVLTVDTAVAHVAATVGVKTLLLLPSAPDWRWGLNSSKTPWYDCITIFRQDTATKWDKPVTEVYKHLIDYIKQEDEVIKSLNKEAPNSIFEIKDGIVDLPVKESAD